MRGEQYWYLFPVLLTSDRQTKLCAPRKQPSYGSGIRLSEMITAAVRFML